MFFLDMGIFLIHANINPVFRRWMAQAIGPARAFFFTGIFSHKYFPADDNIWIEE
jgi:hypothetical protein